MDKTMTRALTIAAIEQAIDRHRTGDGLIFHSDRGVQYAAYELSRYLERKQDNPKYDQKRKLL